METIEKGCGCVTYKEWSDGKNYRSLMRTSTIKCTYHGGTTPTTITAEMVKKEIGDIAQQIGTLQKEMDDKIKILGSLQ